MIPVGGVPRSECDDVLERLPLRSWRRWIAYDHTIWLVFLAFWFVQPVAGHEPLGKWLWLFLALAVFLPAYLIAQRGPRRFRWAGVLALFIVALLYVPINPG